MDNFCPCFSYTTNILENWFDPDLLRGLVKFMLHLLTCYYIILNKKLYIMLARSTYTIRVLYIERQYHVS